jgi:hypothetical protein
MFHVEQTPGVFHVKHQETNRNRVVKACGKKKVPTVECAAYLLLLTLAELRCSARLASEERGLVVLASPGDPKHYAALSVVFRQAEPATRNAAVSESAWSRPLERSTPEWASASKASRLLGDEYGVAPKLKWATEGGEFSVSPRRHSILLQWKATLR